MTKIQINSSEPPAKPASIAAKISDETRNTATVGNNLKILGRSPERATEFTAQVQGLENPMPGEDKTSKLGKSKPFFQMHGHREFTATQLSVPKK